MCAIFGIYAVNKEELLKKISKSQLYRGPDEQNFYFEKEKPLFLGSNRLAVVDKAGGQQPMFSEDKNLIIVFNGCIFNFKEIRNFLEKKGIIFKTSSDTEVLIKSYSYFGEKCFNYFDGMWACAIYDKNTNSLILSRDYLGQKPIYYLYKRYYNVFVYILFAHLLHDFSLFSKLSYSICLYRLHKFHTYIEPFLNIIISMN